MRNITLQRFSQDKVTFGKLKIEWLPEHKDIYTIELPWKDNQHDISCIPAGIYRVIRFNSPAHGMVWKLLGTEPRQDVEMHSGNFACFVKLPGSSHDTDTKGCILPGMALDEGVPMVQRSKEAMSYLYTLIGDDDFMLEVKNP